MAFPNRKYLRYKTVELIEAGESFLKENNIIELKEIQYEIFCRQRPYTARKLEDIKTKITLFLENNLKENKISNNSTIKKEETVSIKIPSVKKSSSTIVFIYSQSLLSSFC